MNLHDKKFNEEVFMALDPTKMADWEIAEEARTYTGVPITKIAIVTPSITNWASSSRRLVAIGIKVIRVLRFIFSPIFLTKKAVKVAKPRTIS